MSALVVVEECSEDEVVIDLRDRAHPAPPPTDGGRRGVRLKRAVDLVLGIVLAVAVTPFVLAAAAWLALTLRAWPFFVQERIGQHGRRIAFLKLRTLPPSTPRYALKSESVRTTTRFAGFLRDRHLDELPQLYLVPLGRLSLVGPRPKMPDLFEPVPAAYAAVRTSVPQGCTGLWQVGADTDALPHESPGYDYLYVAESTLRMDLWILWRTALVMLRLGRPVELHEVPSWVRRNGSGPSAIVIDLRGDEPLQLEAV